MKTEYLSVNEFAKAVNVTVQAIYKRIRKDDLKPFIKKQNGKIYIDKSAIGIYNIKNSEEKENHSIIEILRVELDEKNKQIESLLNRLDQQQQLLDQQQKLMLLDQQKILALEEAHEGQEARKGILSIFRRKRERRS